MNEICSQISYIPEIQSTHYRTQVISRRIALRTIAAGIGLITGLRPEIAVAQIPTPEPTATLTPQQEIDKKYIEEGKMLIFKSKEEFDAAKDLASEIAKKEGKDFNQLNQQEQFVYLQKVVNVPKTPQQKIDTAFREEQPQDSASQEISKQPLGVYQLHLNSKEYVIRGFRDENFNREGFPIDKSRTVNAGIAHRNIHPVDDKRVITQFGDWGNTGIFLRLGQTVEISATGRVRINDGISQEYFYNNNCRDSDIYDPDGNTYWNNTRCPPGANKWLPRGTGVIIGSLTRLPGYNVGQDRGAFRVGSYWKGMVDGNGYLYLRIEKPVGRYGVKGGYDITVNVYQVVPTPTPADTRYQQELKDRFVTFTPTPSRTTELEKQDMNLGLKATIGGVSAVLGILGISLLLNRRINRVNTTATATGTPTSTTSTHRRPAPIPGASPNPNVAPNYGPYYGSTQKGIEWIAGQLDFERRWQIVQGKLPPKQAGETGHEPEHVLNRFKAGMSIVHEVSLNDAINIPTLATRVRAGLEYLIPQIWPDDRIFKRFFNPRFNAGFLNGTDLSRIIYLPEQYRSLSRFNTTQKRDINTIHKILIHAMHTDALQQDSDPNLKDFTSELLIQFNTSWPYIEGMTRQSP